MRIKNYERLVDQMQVGKVYRRHELLPFSKSLDRDLTNLIEEGVVSRLSAGLYCIQQRLICA